MAVSRQAHVAKLRVLSCSEGKQEKTGSHVARRRVSLLTPAVTHLLPIRPHLPQQSHTYPNKATPTPTRPHLLIVPLLATNIFKPPYLEYLIYRKRTKTISTELMPFLQYVLDWYFIYLWLFCQK